MLGLTESMAHARAEGRPADIEAAARLLELIEAHGTFVPADVVTRREYRAALRKKYAKYLEDAERK